MLIRKIDHALTTIHCTLDGMEAVIQMIMEVQTMNADAVSYLLFDTYHQSDRKATLSKK